MWCCAPCKKPSCASIALYFFATCRWRCLPSFPIPQRWAGLKFPLPPLPRRGNQSWRSLQSFVLCSRQSPQGVDSRQPQDSPSRLPGSSCQAADEANELDCATPDNPTPARPLRRCRRQSGCFARTAGLVRRHVGEPPAHPSFPAR
jgi:hypothetical protein